MDLVIKITNNPNWRGGFLYDVFIDNRSVCFGETHLSSEEENLMNAMARIKDFMVEEYNSYKKG